MRTSNFNFRQLILAREYRGYTQSELSSAIPGLSQPNLSKFEKGLGGLSDENLEKIANFLNFPYSFFEERINNFIESAHYRKRTSITQKKKKEIETKIKLLGFIVDKMAESVEWPEYKFSSYDVENNSPEYIAQFIRRKLQLDPFRPIDSVIGIIERNGIIIIEIDQDYDQFDGVSFMTDEGIPVIVINSNFSNDRKRFTLAHELGHMIMHITYEKDFPIAEYRDKEEEANKFASEFLMPANAIKASLVNLKLADLPTLKKYWLTSMSSIIRRAKSLGTIDHDRYSYLNIELSRRGWKSKEPYDVEIDSPKLFDIAYKMHKNDLGFDNNDFVNAFSLPIDILNDFFETKRNSSKLKVIR